ncbi:hypothetical protein EAE96_003824 [Botrytis aclada]|nr:hypothetical protein EAE96_003824 [Botrytis aclada]
MQKALATFHADLKSFAAAEALEPTNSGEEGFEPLTKMKIPGLTLINSDEIVKPKEPSVRDFYHKIGRGLNGSGFDPYLGIFLLARDEDPKIRIEDQVGMKDEWIRLPWKSCCGNLPVILQFLNKNYRSMKEGGETMPYKAFESLKSLGSRLKQEGRIEEKMNFSDKEAMIAMARFLGMSQESIEEKIAEKVEEDMSQQMASKDVSVKNAAQESSDFISFDDPIDSEADEGKEITVPSKKALEKSFAGLANNFPHFKHPERKRKFEE